MTLLAAITIDASMTLREAIHWTSGEAGKMHVAIRRTEGNEVRWHTWTVGEIRAVATAPDSQLDASLTDALNLRGLRSVAVFESGTSQNLDSSSGVLLRGTELLGVLRPDGGHQGALEAMQPATIVGSGGAAAAAARAAGQRPFSAYPALTAPERVAAGQEFELQIGLSATPVTGVTGGPITGVVPEEFQFDLQVVADGFAFPAGSKAELHITRDSPGAAQATVKLVAPEVTSSTGIVGNLEVLFFYEGNLCGQAMRTVAVGDAAATNEAVTADSASSVAIPEVPAPDLTVKISKGSADNRLLWTFSTPHEIPDVPSEPATTELDNVSARSFALDRVRTLADWDKNPLTPAKLIGIGEEISKTMPSEFWLVLDAVWAKKQADGKSGPSLLIVSEDPYVPWELAATTEAFARSERLEPTKPPFLGAQLRIGRWIPPVSTPFGGDIPTLPPPTNLEIGHMVVFVGDYQAIHGQRPLPLAMEEGEKLADRYRAIKRNAVVKDVTGLLRDDIVVDDVKVAVDAIHFACHGEVSANPKHNGIVLSDDNTRLGADMISGSAIGKTSSPFVFLNACQLGVETAGLDGNYAGLAGAFLDQGATGFISPLWSVDDEIAQEVALDFYDSVFASAETTSVADVLRELRSRFDVASDNPQASYLAYVYYGHPDLKITKTNGGNNGST